MPFDCSTVWNTLEFEFVNFNSLAHSQQADANGVQIPDNFHPKGDNWSPNIPTEPHQGPIYLLLASLGIAGVFPQISTLSSPAMPCSKPDRHRVELLKAGRYYMFPLITCHWLTSGLLPGIPWPVRGLQDSAVLDPGEAGRDTGEPGSKGALEGKGPSAFLHSWFWYGFVWK